MKYKYYIWLALCIVYNSAQHSPKREQSHPRKKSLFLRVERTIRRTI